MLEAHARRTDPQTSHEAAKAVTPKLTHCELRVLDFARKRGRNGFTDIELEDAMGDHGATFRTRRQELTTRGLIRDTGRTSRDAGDPRRRIVWVIA